MWTIWCVAFAVAFVHDFFETKQVRLNGFDDAAEHTSGERAWTLANLAVKSYKEYRHGWSDGSITNPEWK